MADTWDAARTGAPLRPRPRPEERTAGPARPEPRPDDLGVVAPAAVPAPVQADATVPGALALDRLALIGLIDGPQGPRALLRTPEGAVVRVAPGAAVGGAVVTAVDEARVRLRQGGRELVLTMPG